MQWFEELKGRHVRGAAWCAASLGIFLLGTVLLTWPLVRHLNSHLPLGDESVSTVPLHNLWIQGWNSLQLGKGYDGYWDAPIFFPAPNSFTFGDPQPFTGLLGLIFGWAPLPARYNLQLILYLVLNGWVTFLILHRVGLDPLACLGGGLFFQWLPFLTQERGVIQLQPVFFPLLGAIGFWALLMAPRWRHAALFILGSVGTFLTSEYYFAYLLLILPILMLINFTPPFRRVFWGLAAALIVMGLIAPTLIVQWNSLAQMGFSRSVATIQATSAELVDYLKPPHRLWVSEAFSPGGGTVQHLLPGLGILLLGVLGFTPSSRLKGRTRAAFIALIGISLILSLGGNLRLGEWSPYLAMVQWVPGLSLMRSPFRFAVLLQTGAAFAAAFGLDAVLRRWSWIGIVLGIAVVLELTPKPERLAPFPESSPAWRQVIEREKPQVWAHLPWPSGRTAAQYERTTMWMVQSLGLPGKMINGYSAYFPQTNGQLRDLMAGFPSLQSMRVLQAVGVEVVVVHGDQLVRDTQNYVQSMGHHGLFVLYKDRTTLILKILNSSLNTVDAYKGRWHFRLKVEQGEYQLQAYLPADHDQVYVYSPANMRYGWLVGWGQGEEDVGPF